MLDCCVERDSDDETGTVKVGDTGSDGSDEVSGNIYSVCDGRDTNDDGGGGDRDPDRDRERDCDPDRDRERDCNPDCDRERERERDSRRPDGETSGGGGRSAEGD